MGVRYPGRASIDPSAPEAVGVCDRCGQLYNLRDLRYQPVYAGPNVLVTRLRVCTITCWDELNLQLKTIRIPPDPWPVSDPRVENFAVDEKNFLDLKAIIGKSSMFLARSSFDGALNQGRNVTASIDGTSVFNGDLRRDIDISASIDGTSVFNGDLRRDIDISASIDGTSVFNGDLQSESPITINVHTVLSDAGGDDVTPFSESMDIGVASDDRLVFITLSGLKVGTDPLFSSVTIGGVGATRAVSILESTDDSFAEIWWALVTSGTTATVTATLNTGKAFFGQVTSYSVSGADTTTPVESSDTSTAAALSDNISLTPIGGYAILACAFAGNNSTDPDVTWTNLTEDSETYSVVYSNTTASRADTVSPGALNITVSVSSADTIARITMAGVVIQPA